MGENLTQLVPIIYRINLINSQRNFGKPKKINKFELNRQFINVKTFEIKEQIIEQQINLNFIKPNLRPFTFELMNQNTIKQEVGCYAIAINNDNSIVLAGCALKLSLTRCFNTKLYEEIKSFCIWKYRQTIGSLLLNNNENFIISGSYDSSIKFWNKQNGWLCQQTIKDHTNYVYSLSLIEKQDKLISCSLDSQIFVIEYSQNDQKWNVIQKIKVEQHGRRLSFINDNQFTFQPYIQEQMHVYYINSRNQQFFKSKQITVKSGSLCCINQFPQQYLKCKCLLVNKNGYRINLIRKLQNGDFLTEQTIKFDHPHIFGQLSDDGEYLITWDQKSKEIQIRKCEEL
ncbi:unnamed protein product [Paramecium pentaurelia]|uniref:Uncharacterized protein n=1 Tax=Paramecium pentaurelia TaxID=43138 RepID=A0A8S1WL13_9CILI|nr:unnamed protein product [Paramecium pentaurelia]